MPTVLPPSTAAFHRFLYVALLCLGAVTAAYGEGTKDRKERKDVAIPPPPPIAQEIKVDRGQEVIIPLRIYGQRNEALTFLIRKPPKTGQLSGLKMTTANSAIIHYRSTNDHNVHTDVFEYSVKSSDGVSAAVPVQIEIIDQPAELAGPAEVLFPPQLAGTTVTQTVELMNRGGMTAEGECRVEPPWKLEGAPEYRIAPGARLFAKVTFAPDRAGDFLGDLRFSSQPDRPVVLRGISRDALAVKPASLRLATEAATPVRAAVFELTNNTETEQTVRVMADKRLLCESELTIRSGQTLPVVVRTAEDDAAELDTTLTLQTGPHIAQVSVLATALPATIRAVERAIDLGIVTANTMGNGKLTLRNRGGQAGRATLSVPAPFRVSPQPVDLSPGATVEVPVTLEPYAPGAIEQAIQVRAGSDSFNVPIKAIIVAPGTSASRGRSSSDSPAEMSAPSTPMPMNVHDIEFGKADPKTIVRPILVEPTRCVLEWHAELSDAQSFVAERRQLYFDDGKIAARWEKLSLKIERTGQYVHGTIDKLAPGQRYTVRVLGVDRYGDPGPRVFETSFGTAVPKPSRVKSSLLVLVVLAAAGAGAFLFWRRNQPPPRRTAGLKKTQRIA
jgi:hypothetical protein